MCGKTFYLLCFYQKDVGTNRLYNPGSSIADLCADCGLPACVAGLCTNEFKPGSSFITKLRDKRLIDETRNRRLLATGWAVDKKIYYAKPAKTMNKLVMLLSLDYACSIMPGFQVYVKTLEDAALNYISCDKEVPENDPPVGESFWKGSYELSHVDAMKEAMKEWWQPLEATGLGDELSYTNEMQQGPFKYFANIAHDKTTEIGCAVKTCLKQGTTLIDCRYNNVISVDDPIYEVGTMPCRPCPTNSACSKLGGLCEINPTP
ncbi:hypothetical protein ANCCEY_11122 [Ancylostoma ceylanicum]|uniref:SCP domain-containing protein n=1 Tax=Ancylostoma ceylanicum TaxID=53326 RepID=A0A0D6LIP1_9BILA|nr:hypothetical protein ANCCEY_11122 [Ancylostoma ceylanicum]